MQSQSLAPETDAFALKTDDLSVYNIHLANYRGWGLAPVAPSLGPARAQSTHENAATHLLRYILSRSPQTAVHTCIPGTGASHQKNDSEQLRITHFLRKFLFYVDQNNIKLGP